MGRLKRLAVRGAPAVMDSVAVVEPPRAVVLVATAAAIAISGAVRPSLVEAARPTVATIAVATVIRPAAAPRTGVEARAAASCHELNYSVTAGLFKGVE
jgi:hypothetical protein